MEWDQIREQLPRALTWVLAIAVLASLVGVLYIAVTPQQTTDPYTEFYILGTDGNASNYPTNLSVGETGTLIVGISNHEHRTVTYTVLFRFENRTAASRTVTVNDDETWEDEVSFTPQSTGRKPLRILLYKGENADPSQDAYRSLRLWVNVSN